MSRPKGIPKTGGRTKGTPNRISGTLKEWISSVIDKNRMQFEADIGELEPKDRVLLIEKLMQYIVPKQAAQKVDIDFDTLSDEQLQNIINKLTDGMT